MKSFHFTNVATEISELLDSEPDVARYYADLVPISLKPEEFWSRYFFRIRLISRNGAINLDDEDDEEELEWESTDKDEVAANLFDMKIVS